MTLLEKLKQSENINLSITSMITTENSSFVTKLNVEHSWHSSNVDALDMYDIVESEITNYETFENILMKNFEPADFKFENRHVWLKNNFEIIEKYLHLFENYIMDYLEYYDSKF